MRAFLVAALVSMLALPNLSAIYGQQPAATTEQDEAVAETNGALKELVMGFHTSFAEKRLARLGDEAANAIVRSHTLEEMRDESTAVGIAQVISLSFASPTLIKEGSSREPKLSSLLLAYLLASVNTARAREAIMAASATIARLPVTRTKP